MDAGYVTYNPCMNHLEDNDAIKREPGSSLCVLKEGCDQKVYSKKVFYGLPKRPTNLPAHLLRKSGISRCRDEEHAFFTVTSELFENSSQKISPVLGLSAS